MAVLLRPDWLSAELLFQFCLLAQLLKFICSSRFYYMILDLGESSASFKRVQVKVLRYLHVHVRVVYRINLTWAEYYQN